MFTALLASAPDPSLDTGAVSTYLWAFGQGVLVDFTPCVYPLIPITVAVFGAQGVSRARALFLATAYVLGMAVLYTSLGVLVALTGGQFGAWLAKPAVVLPITGVLLALAASMFGAFDLQLPPSLQAKLNTVGGAGPLSAFLMGLVSGFISAPCTGPVLLSLLAYIAKASAAGESIAYGGSLLFTYALGMGTLFFAVALGASLFRPGPWMEYVKSVFGIALVVMAFWFLRPISRTLRDFTLDPSWGLYAGLGVVLVGLVAGAVHLSFYGGVAERARKAAAIVVVVFGGVVGLNNIMYVPEGQWKHVEDLDGFAAAVAVADEFSKPVVVDFGAEWCTPCKEMDKLTFADAAVEAELNARFELVKIKVDNVEDEGQEGKKLLYQAMVGGTLPGVAIFDSSARLGDHLAALERGEPLPAPAVKLGKFTPAPEFLKLLQQVQ
ncbi:MAG: thioredoxin family protein [Myxococcales bacterium]|nr:thioredoxin family protein [Myxococcales bacterium]